MAIVQCSRQDVAKVRRRVRFMGHRPQLPARPIRLTFDRKTGDLLLPTPVQARRSFDFYELVGDAFKRACQAGLIEAYRVTIEEESATFLESALG
jgi:hypothetical protein